MIWNSDIIACIHRLWNDARKIGVINCRWLSSLFEKYYTALSRDFKYAFNSRWFDVFLQEFGHHVRLATHANFSAFVKSAGVEFYPLGGDPRVLAGCKGDPNIKLSFVSLLQFGLVYHFLYSCLCFI